MTNLPPSPYGSADDHAPRPHGAAEAEPSSPAPPEETGPPSPYRAAEAEAASAAETGAGVGPEPQSGAESESGREATAADAPASPYRAADISAPSDQQQRPAPQQPSNLGQFYPQNTPPYGQFTQTPGQAGSYPQAPGPYGSYPQNPGQYGSYPPNPPQYGQPQNHAQYAYAPNSPVPPKRINGLGLTSLIIGIVSMLIAITPPSSFGTFLLGFVGVVFGIIGLALPGRPRRQATWGLVLSATSMVLGIVLTFVYGFAGVLGFNNSDDQVPREEPPVAASPFTSPSVEPIGSPAALGTDVELTDADGSAIFTASVTASVLNAGDLVLAVEGNSPAPEGTQWALVTLDVTRLAVSTLGSSRLAVEFVSTDGEVHTAAVPPAAAPGEALDAAVNSLEIGDSGSASVAIAIPTEGAADGNWSVQCRDSLSGGQMYYFEVA